MLYILLLISILFGPAPTHAAEFNPHFLISDEEMQAATSMNRADVEAFLKEKGGYLATLKIEDHLGKKRSVADIIVRAAKEHTINPKYLLVKLQKEQSLISAKQPTEKQLSWATGYGVCDACSTTDPAIQKHKGFGTQVDSAAGIIRWYYDNKDTQSWIKREGTTYTISNQAITPQSDATGFLYTYTPHIHGNKNFWLLWQEWFDQTYPNGSLLKSAESPTVYVIDDNQKRPFATMSSLITRYDPSRIITVPASELERYQTGKELSFPNYSVLRHGSNYYLLDYDVLKPFDSEQTVRSLGFHPDEIIDITDEDLVSFDTSNTGISQETLSPTGKLVFIKETGTTYYLKDAMFHALLDPQIAKINFPNLTVASMSLSILADYEQGDPLLFQDGTLIGITGFNKIYSIDKGKKRHIANEEVFLGLGYSWNQVVWTNEIIGSSYPLGEPVYLRSVSPNNETTPSSPNTNSTNTEAQSEEEGAQSSDWTTDLVRTPKEKTTIIGSDDLLPSVQAYAIADYETGEILAGKNINIPRPMASLTKVVTAYQLLKENIDLTKTTTYDPAIHTAKYNQFRTTKGEVFTNDDLMKSLIVSSLNPPAKMLVSSVSKQESSFVKKMNTTLDELGLTNTTIVDPAGVEVENVTTPEEYVKLVQSVMKQKKLRTYLGMTSYTYDEVVDLDGKPTHLDTHSNELTKRNNLPFTIIASKTGFLYEAGTCLMMVIERPTDGKRFIVLTMGNESYTNRFDAPTLLATYAIDSL